jgi:hypothetical protein
MTPRCDHALTNGRTCCHVEGHDGRHSHTWQRGDARYLDVNGKVVDMETGEVAGYSGDLGQTIIGEIISERDSQPQLSAEEKQAKARRVLEVQYGVSIPENQPPVHATPPRTGFNWHYEGDTKAIGVTSAGKDVEFDFTTGKVTRLYSLNQRRDAAAYARRFGAAKAARKFDIPRKTVTTWVNRGM